MANHKSSLKRIRQTATRKAHNHYYAKTTRNAVRVLRATTDKAAAEEFIVWCAKFAEGNNMNITISVSEDPANASEAVKQYL